MKRQRSRKWMAFALAMIFCITSAGTVLATTINSAIASQGGELTEKVINEFGGGSVPLEYFSFVCDSTDIDDDRDLSADVKDALRSDSVPAGMVSATLPQVLQANEQAHILASVTVNNVPVYALGMLEIEGQEYVYYITDEIPDAMTVYSVLDPEDGANGQIKVEYRHTTAYTVSYEIWDADRNSVSEFGGYDLNDIFGIDRTTAAEATEGVNADYSVNVHIPRGYKATVSAYNLDESGQISGAPVSTLKLGEMPQYANQATNDGVVELQGDPFTLTGILEVTGISANQKVVVEYEPITEYSFSAEAWSKTKAVSDGKNTYLLADN